MKLLLQRTLSNRIEGPFWVESAHLDGTDLHGFLILARDAEEPRFAADGTPHWLSGGRIRNAEKQTLSDLSTFKFDFAGPELVSLQCRDEESPYELVVQGRFTALDSSLTHLAPIPESGDWLISSLETLYRGPLNELRSLGPTPSRRFSPGPRDFFYCRGPQLLRQSLDGGRAESIFSSQEGHLAYPCWTPRGVLVTQEECEQHHLWLVDPENKEAVSLWSGPAEWIYAGDFY